MKGAAYDSLCNNYANALRLIRLTDVKFKAGMSRGDLCAIIVDETGCCRATGYRHAAALIDVLGLEVCETRAAEQARALLRRSRSAGVFSQAA